MPLLFWRFDIWGLSDPGETVPPRASQFLETVNLPCSEPFIWKLANPEHTLPPISSKLLNSRPISTCPNHLSDTKPTRDSPYAQSLWESFKVANLKPTYSAFLSHRNRNKESCPQPSYAPTASWVTWYFPVCPYLHRAQHAPCSCKLSHQLSFWWQSPDLCTSPYLNNKPTFKNTLQELKRLEGSDSDDPRIMYISFKEIKDLQSWTYNKKLLGMPRNIWPKKAYGNPRNANISVEIKN